MASDLEEKLEALGVPTSIPDEDQRRRLKAILRENHPDRTGGHFKSEKQERLYQMANDALEIIDLSSASKNQLQVVAEGHSALLKLMHEERQLLNAREQRETAGLAEARANSAIVNSVHSTYFPVQVGSWGIAAVSAAIALLNNPLGGFIDEAFADRPVWTHAAKITLGLISLLGLLLGFYVRQREEQRTNRLKAIMSDDGIELLLQKYSEFLFSTDNGRLELRYEIRFDRPIFLSFGVLADAIGKETGIRDRPTCEATADAIIQKLLQRELILPTTKRNISRVYEIDKGLVKSLIHRITDIDDQGAQEALRASREALRHFRP